MPALTAAALALLCVFTIGAGVTVARLLPGRLALWRQPYLAHAEPAPAQAGEQALSAASGAARGGQAITAGGLSRALAPVVASPVFGSHLGVLVTDLATGRVLYAQNSSSPFTPASTTKVATATAALQVLGPDARFTTSVVAGRSADGIVLVGGGDPTLAAGPARTAEYPQPSTLAELAARTARALLGKGRRSVHLGYDTSLYTGAGLAPGWPPRYVTGGDVSVITPLEADQGRVTASGRPQDTEASAGLRAADPAALAAQSFAGFLRSHGIKVLSGPVPEVAPRRAHRLASVASPALSQVIGEMLEQSNNVIAENLARQVALAERMQPSFAGGAAAVARVLRRLGITGVSLVDGSGLSPEDRITPSALVGLIRLDARRPRLRSVLTALPVYGFSGTLANYPGNEFFSGRGPGLGTVRAKTGNLSTVAGLTGIVYAKNGQLLAFAVMADKFTSLAAEAPAMTRLANVLAGCGCG